MNTPEEIMEILYLRLSKKRFAHSRNVAEEAKKLAFEYGANPEDAYLAGLLHDICKEIPQQEQADYVKLSRRNVCDAEREIPALWHSIAGAYYCEFVIGCLNEDILNAIRFHTAGRSNMSQLEEIIYMADLISADRNYKDVAKMRRLAYQDIKKAMLEALKFSISDVMMKKSLIPIHTTEGYNFYCNMFSKEKSDKT